MSNARFLVIRRIAFGVILFAVFAFASGFGGCPAAYNPFGGNPTNPPSTACPASTTAPAAPSTTTNYPSCGGNSGSLTNPSFAMGSNTNLTMTTDIVAPATSVPAPTPAPAAVVLYVTLVPAQTFQWSTGPATQITIPGSTAHPFYLAVDDLTTQTYDGSFPDSMISGQTIMFSGGGSAFTMTQNHTYLFEYYYI